MSAGAYSATILVIRETAEIVNMPTYLYECRTCEKTFEVEQRITEDALTDCHCGAKGSVKRLIQPTAMLFKGEGFFINDSSPAPKAGPKDDCTGHPPTCGKCASDSE
jgi:putative FmdB family regulatory protein